MLLWEHLCLRKSNSFVEMMIYCGFFSEHLTRSLFLLFNKFFALIWENRHVATTMQSDINENEGYSWELFDFTEKLEIDKGLI